MGSCFSSDGSDSERREPAETSQIAPAPSERSRIAAEPAASVVCTEMAESAVTEESVHAEFISNHVAESEVTEEAGNAEVISNHGPEKHVRCKVFTYEELYSATDGFRADLFLGQGGFGTVYKGFLDSTNQVVAIKMLDPQGLQGDREFLTEVLVLSKLHHPNLVKLIGCCADRGQRLLVYEYMPLGALISHIHDLPPGKQPLDWSTRMKVLADAAKGLQHLHDNVDPPVINRDVKCGNILLGEEYHAKLSDFGLAKLGPTGDNTHVSTRILGTPGYCAPEYLMSGKLTIKSDIYSFGVVMLEVLTGRKAKDDSLAGPEQNLALWAPTLVNKEDFHKLADPTLQDEYHATSMYRALTVAAHCVNRTASKRPPIAHVVEALAEISEMESRSRKRSALQRSSAPGTPTGTKSGWDQAQDQEERS